MHIGGIQLFPHVGKIDATRKHVIGCVPPAYVSGLDTVPGGMTLPPTFEQTDMWETLPSRSFIFER